MRAWLALVVLVLLAGCSTPRGGDGDEPGPDGASSSPPPSSGTDPAVQPGVDPDATAAPLVSLSECSNKGGLFSVPAADARAVLPDGFEPVASTNDPRGGAVVYAIVVTCEGMLIDGEDLGPATFAYAELAVTPPAAYQVDGITDCTVPLAFLTIHDDLAEFLSEWRMGTAGRSDAFSMDTIGAGVAQVQRVTVSLGSTELSFAFGEGDADTLGVGSGDFMLYGVQDKQVHAMVRGTAGGNGAAHYAPAIFQAAGMPALANVQPAAAGFAASGFTLAFQQVALPLP